MTDQTPTAPQPDAAAEPPEGPKGAWHIPAVEPFPAVGPMYCSAIIAPDKKSVAIGVPPRHTRPVCTLSTFTARMNAGETATEVAVDEFGPVGVICERPGAEPRIAPAVERNDNIDLLLLRNLLDAVARAADDYLPGNQANQPGGGRHGLVKAAALVEKRFESQFVHIVDDDRLAAMERALAAPRVGPAGAAPEGPA